MTEEERNFLRDEEDEPLDIGGLDKKRKRQEAIRDIVLFGILLLILWLLF